MGWYDRLKGALTRRNDSVQTVAALPVRRTDAWTNPQSGLGQLSFDRSLSTTWANGVNLTLLPEILTSLHRYNPLARRIIEKPVALALSKGVHWSIGEGHPDAAQALMDEWSRLGAWRHTGRGRAWGRLYGCGLLVAHIDDMRFPTEPVAETFRRIDAVRAVSWRRIARVDVARSGSRTGEPEVYWIRSAGAGATPIHYTRCHRFDGAEVDADTYVENGGTHDSVLTAPYRTMARVGSGGDSLASQLDQATKGVWKIKGLHEAIAAGDADFIRDWIQTVEMSWSAFRGAALDAEGEDFQWLARPMKDSVEVYFALMTTLSAAVDMPMTELFGQAPSGLSTDDQSGTRKWYARIDAEERAGALDPCLAWLTNLLTRQRSAPALNGAEIAWEWPSLWSMTAKEEAEVRKLHADTAAVYIDKGVLLPGEVTRSRFGGSRYSPEIQLDEEARAAAALEAGTAELTPEQQLQQGRLALEALHTPATSQAVAAVLGWPVPTPEQIEAFWAQRGGGRQGVAARQDEATRWAQKRLIIPGGVGSITIHELQQRVDSVDGDGTKVGLFVRLPDELASQRSPLSQDDSPPHVTLLIIGDVSGREDELLGMVSRLAAEAPVSRAVVGRIEALTNRQGQPVIYQDVRFQHPGEVGTSYPRLDRWRDKVVEELHQRAMPVADVSPHMWHPHLTLAYLDAPDAVWTGGEVRGSWQVAEIEIWGLPHGPHIIALGAGGGES